MVHQYFTHLYAANSQQVFAKELLLSARLSISDKVNAKLTKHFTIDEFKMAVFQMHPDKSPGPDGFNPAFF